MIKIKKKKSEKGFILVTSLIVLLIMTLIVLYNFGSSRVEEKMSGGIEDKTIAFQNAETALRYAEAYIYNNDLLSSSFTTNCAGGLCFPATGATPQWEGITWETDTQKTISLPENTIPKAYSQPKFIIEFLGTIPVIAGESMKYNPNMGNGGNAYRVTVFAFGNRNGTVVRLQSVFVKR